MDIEWKEIAGILRNKCCNKVRQEESKEKRTHCSNRLGALMDRHERTMEVRDKFKEMREEEVKKVKRRGIPVSVLRLQEF